MTSKPQSRRSAVSMAALIVVLVAGAFYLKVQSEGRRVDDWWFEPYTGPDAHRMKI